MGPDELNEKVTEVRDLLEAKLRVRGRDLDHQLSRAGRRLPKNIRRDAHALAQADLLLRNPKLARMVNLEMTEMGQQRVVAYLQQIDPRQALVTRRLNWLAGIALNLLLVFIIVIAMLRWRGLV